LGGYFAPSGDETKSLIYVTIEDEPSKWVYFSVSQSVGLQSTFQSPKAKCSIFGRSWDGGLGRRYLSIENIVIDVSVATGK